MLQNAVRMLPVFLQPEHFGAVPEEQKLSITHIRRSLKRGELWSEGIDLCLASIDLQDDQARRIA